jgi:cytochrome c553
MTEGNFSLGAPWLQTSRRRISLEAWDHGEKFHNRPYMLRPVIAGRSPSYIARQLYGARHGLWTPLMAPVIAHLDTTDILTAAAYLASLKP